MIMTRQAVRRPMARRPMHGFGDNPAGTQFATAVFGGAYGQCINQTKQSMLAQGFTDAQASSAALNACTTQANIAKAQQIDAANRAAAAQSQAMSAQTSTSSGVPVIVWIGAGVVILGGAAYYFLR